MIGGRSVMWTALGLLLLTSVGFEAPLPKGPVLARRSGQQDAYGQRVSVLIYRSDARFERIKRFYGRVAKARRLVRVTERRESKDPRYIPNPDDPSSSIPVLRVLNLDYTGPWAAVFVRPLASGTLIAVVERKPPPEVEANTVVPGRLEIPRAVFELEKLRPLTRP